MQRIGFRRALPLVFTLIHFMLVWSSARQSHAASIIFGDSGYRSVAYQEDRSVSVELFEPPPLKPVQKIALILELPAMFLATLISAILFLRNDTAWLYASIPFVPLVWYVIGRWLDGLLGYCNRVRLPRLLRQLIAVPSGVLLCVSLAGFTPLYHHRTADTSWMFSGLVLWSGLCLTMMSSSAQRHGY